MPFVMRANRTSVALAIVLPRDGRFQGANDMYNGAAMPRKKAIELSCGQFWDLVDEQPTWHHGGKTHLFHSASSKIEKMHWVCSIKLTSSGREVD
jgi:hypothetical protein